MNDYFMGITARASVPLAYLVHGLASGHAICSGNVLAMTAVCPGVSISAMTSIPR